MPTFIGLDLAWTTKNESGICWLEGDSRENLRCTRLEADVCATEQLADELNQVEGPLVVTIDAPVLYTPERWVEPEIARRFGKYKASAHSSHAAVNKGFKAGINLGVALADLGFTLDPHRLLAGNEESPCAVEVYPHTIHVRLFGLSERLKYKKGLVADKRAGLKQYQKYLVKLIDKEAPDLLESIAVQEALTPHTAQEAKGKSLKRLDDTLDGLTCALAAWLIWKEPDRWEMIGDLNGYIVAPKPQDG